MATITALSSAIIYELPKADLAPLLGPELEHAGAIQWG